MLWTIALSFLLVSCSTAFRRARTGSSCVEFGLYINTPANKIQIPIDHFHNETRYEPHSNGTFSNRFWFNAEYYKPGGPVIVENKGESSFVDTLDLHVGLLHELARVSSGIAVIFEHRYYGSNPIPVHHLQDFRFLSAEQAMADQAYFAENVVFSGLEQYDLTASNTPWFAIGGSYPGALTAWARIQYPDVFWGAIASSAVTALKENYWEYYDAVGQYSPPKCAETFGKFVSVGDDILLGNNETEIKQFKGLFRYANVNGSNADFASYYLTMPFSTQSVSWVPCLKKYDDIKACRIITSPSLLYAKAQKFEETVMNILRKSKWANETEALTIAFLNYVGWNNGYHKDNTTASAARDLAGRDPPSPRLTYSESWLAWSYQQCTEIGLFQTGDNPRADALPVLSRLITLHYLKNMYCRDQLYINLTETSISAKLNNYGGLNISYPRLMLTGGEVDPWRPATALAMRDTPTRLDYPSTPQQPWYLIPNLGHVQDLDGIYLNQTGPGVPPESIKTVHRLEKDALLRWLGEWHELHPDYDVFARRSLS